MTSKVSIEYTQTFELLLDHLISYLIHFSDEIIVLERIEAFLDRFEAQISHAPESASISPSLQNLGITHFREFHADSFRIIYRLIPANEGLATKVMVDLIAQQKQNLEQLLVHYCLLVK